MVTKSKLRLALAAEHGLDLTKLTQGKREKATVLHVGMPFRRLQKREAKPSRQSKSHHDGNSTTQVLQGEQDSDGSLEEINIDAVDESDTSESSLELETQLPQRAQPSGSVRSEALVQQESDDIPVSDLEDLDDEDRDDLIPHTRLTINNTSALMAALDRISIPTDDATPFATHQSVSTTIETASSIVEVSDDIQRELAFYSQCLEAARQARTRLLAEGVSFSRPKDYFAEMVKQDAHMDKIKAKLVEEASSKRAALEARKLRDLKKFGKQFQVAKLQERQKAKRDTLEKIKTLKRKRQESGGDVGANESDVFDIGVDNEIAKHTQRTSGMKRQKKDAKYGYGGKKRHAKSGDAISSGDLTGFNAKKMKAGTRAKSRKTTRPGKSRRNNISVG